MVGVMMRSVTVATGAVLAAIFLTTAASAQAPAAPSDNRLAQASQPAEPAAQRRKPSIRLRVYPRHEGEPDGVYPRYFPGRNAVRDCTATYVQENRPSGTVIVPRMNCFWRPG
jgi:hypothetical protein